MAANPLVIWEFSETLVGMLILLHKRLQADGRTNYTNPVTLVRMC